MTFQRVSGTDLGLFLRSGPRVSELIERSTDRHFDPLAGRRLSAFKLSFGLKEEDSVCRQTVDGRSLAAVLVVARLPFGRLFTWTKDLLIKIEMVKERKEGDYLERYFSMNQIRPQRLGLATGKNPVRRGVDRRIG